MKKLLGGLLLLVLGSPSHAATVDLQGWGIDKAVTPAAVCLSYSSSQCLGVGTVSPSAFYQTTVENALKVFPVDLYGATHNLVANDHAAITAAIAAATAAGGGRVVLGPYSYLASTTITIPQNVELTCTSYGRTILDPAGLYSTKNRPCTIYSQVTGTTPAIINDGWLDRVNIFQVRLQTVGDPTTRALGMALKDGFTGYGVTWGRGAGRRYSNSLVGGFTRCISVVDAAQDVFEHIVGDCTNGMYKQDAHDDDSIHDVRFWQFSTTNRGGFYTYWDVDTVADNGSGLIRLTIPATHDIQTGEDIAVSGQNYGGVGAIGRWTVTRISATQLDLQSSDLAFTKSGTTTTGTTFVAIADTTHIRRGMNITGTGIPASTTVMGIWPSAGGISVSNRTTATATNTMSFTSPAYATGMRVATNTNYRTGNGFNFIDSAGTYGVGLFSYGHSVGFRVQNIGWFSLVNLQCDGGYDFGKTIDVCLKIVGGVGSNVHDNRFAFSTMVLGPGYGVQYEGTGLNNLGNIISLSRTASGEGGIFGHAIEMGDATQQLLVDGLHGPGTGPIFVKNGAQLHMSNVVTDNDVFSDVAQPLWYHGNKLGDRYAGTLPATAGLTVRHETTPQVYMCSLTAPVDEKCIQWITGVDGASVIRALDDAGSTPTNYMTFERPNGVVTAGLKFERPITLAGTAPTCSSTGTGTSPTCTFGGGSNDMAGIIVMTTGTGAPVALGTLTLTFAQPKIGNNPVCQVDAIDTGTAWNVRATTRMSTQSLTAPVFKWDNNAIALSTSTAYHFNYFCFGK